MDVVARVGVIADLVVFAKEVRWMPRVPEVRSKEEFPSKITWSGVCYITSCVTLSATTSTG